MDFESYQELIDLMETTKNKGIPAVIVFHPNVTAADSNESYPTLIVASTENAELVRAMLTAPTPTIDE